MLLPQMAHGVENGADETAAAAAAATAVAGPGLIGDGGGNGDVAISSPLSSIVVAHNP